MGKVRRPRRKLHLEPKTGPSDHQSPLIRDKEASPVAPDLFLKPPGDVFAGLSINVHSLNKNLSDDVQSVKSFKSVKSESGKVLSKKDKIKLRREMLMQKFEVMHERKLLDKRKKTAVVGDLNPLRDALPSLESLLKSRGNVPYKQKQAQARKKRGIEKARTIKKHQIQGIRVFQQMFKNKEYQKDPQSAISNHVKTVLESEKD